MYKPKFKQGGGFGPSGVAHIEVHPKNADRVRVTIKPETWNRETQQLDIGEPVTAELSRADCPTDIQRVIRPGIWYVAMDSKLNKIYGFRPVDGVFDVVFDEFSYKENEVPVPRDKTNVQYPYKYFTAVLRIVDGEAKGMKIPYTLRYHFDMELEPVDQAGTVRETVAYSHPKSKYTPPLVDFMQASGAWKRGPMPYKDNILPMLEKRIKEANLSFKVVLQRGQVRSIVGGTTEFTEEFSPVIET